MIHEEELPAFMEEVRRRALLACDNKPEYDKAIVSTLSTQLQERYGTDLISGILGK